MTRSSNIMQPTKHGKILQRQVMKLQWKLGQKDKGEGDGSISGGQATHTNTTKDADSTDTGGIVQTTPKPALAEDDAVAKGGATSVEDKGDAAGTISGIQATQTNTTNDAESTDTGGIVPTATKSAQAEDTRNLGPDSLALLQFQANLTPEIISQLWQIQAKNLQSTGEAQNNSKRKKDTNPKPNAKQKGRAHKKRNKSNTHSSDYVNDT